MGDIVRTPEGRIVSRVFVQAKHVEQPVEIEGTFEVFWHVHFGVDIGHGCWRRLGRDEFLPAFSVEVRV